MVPATLWCSIKAFVAWAHQSLPGLNVSEDESSYPSAPIQVPPSPLDPKSLLLLERDKKRGRSRLGEIGMREGIPHLTKPDGVEFEYRVVDVMNSAAAVDTANRLSELGGITGTSTDRRSVQTGSECSYWSAQVAAELYHVSNLSTGNVTAAEIPGG